MTMYLKRGLSLLLALVMVFSMVPAGTLAAETAASGENATSTDGNQSINLLSAGVTVLDGQVSVEDSQGKAKVSDGVVTVDATGSLMKEQTNVVTVTNETNGPATLTFTYGVVKHTGITIADQAVNDTGVYTALLSAGGSVTIKVKTKSTATLTLSNISLVPAAEASDITFVYDSTMGSVTVDGAAVSNGHVAEQVTLADGVLLVVAIKMAPITQKRPSSKHFHILIIDLFW